MERLGDVENIQKKSKTNNVTPNNSMAVSYAKDEILKFIEYGRTCGYYDQKMWDDIFNDIEVVKSLFDSLRYLELIGEYQRAKNESEIMYIKAIEQHNKKLLHVWAMTVNHDHYFLKINVSQIDPIYTNKSCRILNSRRITRRRNCYALIMCCF
jgi:hypothetical protein